MKLHTLLKNSHWLFFLIVCAYFPKAQAEQTVSFIATGDTPYFDTEISMFNEMVEKVDSLSPAFVLHVGDFKHSKAECTDSYLTDRAELLNKFKAPLVMLLGDNDWADCVRKAAGGFDPYDRLTFVRDLFYPSTADKQLGIVRQQKKTQYYPENFILERSNILFVGLHVLGHADVVRSPLFKKAGPLRAAANLAWLAKAKQYAKDNNIDTVVVTFHADPFLEKGRESRKHAAYKTLITELDSWAKQLNNRMLIIHGDTHFFRFNTPPFTARPGEAPYSFYRLEVFGSPFVGYVHVTIDAGSDTPFSVSSDLVF